MFSRQQRRETRREHWRKQCEAKARQNLLLNGEPATLREHFAYWLAWRVTAAHNFCIKCMQRDPATADGNQDIMSAPLGWYVPRFIAGWRLGDRYANRIKRELRRMSKV